MLERRELVGRLPASPRRSRRVAALDDRPTSRACCGPRSIRDLGLAEHGLRMVPCEPGLQVVFEDGTRAAVVVGRTSAPREELATHLARTTRRVRPRDRRLHALARYLQPFFLEEPPDLYARGLGEGSARGGASSGASAACRGDELAGPRRGSRPGRSASSSTGISSPTRSSGSILANNVYGMHAPPVPARHRDRPPVPPALGRRARGPGLLRPRDRRDGLDHAGDGGGGAATRAPRSGPTPPVARIDVRGRPRDRRRARGRHRDRGARRGLERRPEAHVPRPGRGAELPDGVPRGRRGDQDGRARARR